jgi:hypothetical protein
MAVGDTYYYANGNSYIQTDSGPMVMFTCDDCGRPAAASLDYVGRVRCSACWPMFHGLVKIKKN